jgi:hypothetical protein
LNRRRAEGQLAGKSAGIKQGEQMRKFLFAICVLAVSCTLHAQRKPANWEDLKTLHSGDKIQVREMNSKKVTGAFLNFSDVAISLQADGASQSIQKQEVESVKLMKNRHRLRNTLILAGAGAGVGAGIGAAAYRSCPSTQTFCLDIGGRSLPAGVGGILGLLGGAAIGVLLPSHETVYTLNAR